MKKINLYIFWSLLLISNLCLAQNPGDNLFDDSYIHEIRVTFFVDTFWDSLENNFRKWSEDSTNTTKISYLPALIQIDGTNVDTIGFREKGFTSNFNFNEDGSINSKKPFKIDMNKFVKKQKYDGLKKINLQNGAYDPSLMRDKLSYNILRKAGLKAPRSAYANVYLNNRYWGLYLMVEQIDKTFLKSNFESGNGNLYKCIYNTELNWLGNDYLQYEEYLEKKTNEKENDWSGLIKFLNVVNNMPIGEIEDSVNAIFNINDFYKSMAIDIIINNWDSYFDHGRNFYMYNEPKSNKFNWIHWDYNFAFSSSKMGIFPSLSSTRLKTSKDREYEDYPMKPLEKIIYNNPNFRIDYLNVFSEILSNNFTSERLKLNILKNVELIRPQLILDSNYFYDINMFDKSLTDNLDDLFGVLPGLKPFIVERAEEVKVEVENLIKREKTRDIFINEIMTSNTMTYSDEVEDYDSWVELYNSTDLEISLKSYSLSDDSKLPRKWVLPDTTIPSGAYLIVWLDNEISEGKLHANFELSKNGGRIQLFNQKNELPLELVNSISFPSLNDDKSYGRKKENLLEWTEFDTPTPNEVNSNITSVDNNPVKLPQQLELFQNYPNPFNPSTTIKYSIANLKTQRAVSLQNTKLTIYDILGREITTLVNEEQNPGFYEIKFDASKLSSGAYYYILKAGDFIQTKKMMLIK